MAAKNETFAIGDQVELLSGGPVMTVIGVDASVKGIGEERDNSIWCSWFSGKKNERASFPSGSLKRAEPETDEGKK